MSSVGPFIEALAQLSWCVGHFQAKGDHPEVAERLRLAEAGLRDAPLELAARGQEEVRRTRGHLMPVLEDHIYAGLLRRQHRNASLGWTS